MQEKYIVYFQTEDDLQTKEGDEDMAKQVQPDVVQIDRYHGEVIELDRKIATQQSQLSGGGKLTVKTCFYLVSFL